MCKQVGGLYGLSGVMQMSIGSARRHGGHWREGVGAGAGYTLYTYTSYWVGLLPQH